MAEQSKATVIRLQDVLISSVSVQKEDYTIAFDEWSDQIVNEEKWDKHDLKQETRYKDPQYVNIPFAMASVWKRPFDAFQNCQIVLYRERFNEYTDLINGSKHLAYNSFVRKFISTIRQLEYLSTVDSWDMESVNSNFTPTTRNAPWRPWHHVYSNCKAGKGEHRPQLNKFGKYIVRLHWFGCWRIVYVDDLLPINKKGEVLLPSTVEYQEGNPNNCKQPLELWPFLLFKALCKIGILTCEKGTEMINYTFVTPLTGWMSQRLSVQGLSMEQLWAVFKKYSLEYRWPEEKPKQKAQKGGRKKVALEEVVKEPLQKFLLFINSSQLDRKITLGTVNVDAVCCYIRETRDIPLERPKLQDELPRWKEFRWLPWAIKNGLYRDVEDAEIRQLRLVEVFRQYDDGVRVQKRVSVSVGTDNYFYSKPKKGDKKKNKKEEKAGKSKEKEPKSTDKGSKKTDKKTDKSSRNSSKSGKSKKTDSKGGAKLLPDESFCLDFECVAKHLHMFTIMTIPSRFRYWLSVTNADVKEKTDLRDKGCIRKLYKYDLTLKPSRNEPIYVYADNVDEEPVFISAQVFGHCEMLRSIGTEGVSSLFNTSVSKLCNVRCCPHYVGEEMDAREDFDAHTHQKRPLVKYLICNHRWDTDQGGRILLGCTTLGDQGISFNLGRGRKVYEIYINAFTYYYLHLLSDVEVKVGSRQEIAEEFSKESERFNEKVYNICRSFGKLAKAFGSPDYKSAMLNFTSSLKPTTEKLSKHESQIVLNNFLNNLMEAVLNYYPLDAVEDVLYGLKILFMDRRFLYRKAGAHRQQLGEPKIEYVQACVCGEDEFFDALLAKRQQKSAMIIQALFSGNYVRRLLKYHQRTNPNHYKFYNANCKLYLDLFTKGSQLAPLLVRKTFYAEDAKWILPRYEIYDDLSNTTMVKIFNGKLVVGHPGWTFVGKYLVQCNSLTGLLLRILFTCDLPKYMIKVFNNDTRKELKMLLNEVLVENLTANVNGYTVVTYGWADTPKTVEWKISFVTHKSLDVNYLDVTKINVMQNVITDVYVPRLNNLICRVFLKLKGSGTITLRFSVSSENLRLKLICKNKEKTFNELSGKSRLVMPLVFLEGEQRRSKPGRTRESTLFVQPQAFMKKRASRASVKKQSKADTASTISTVFYVPETTFHVEAYVEGNTTWKLTMLEHDVSDRRRNMDLYFPLETEEEVDMKPNLMRFNENGDCTGYSGIPPRPYFKLSVVHDGNVNAQLDISRLAEIKSMKEEWYKDDWKRYSKSMALMQQFEELDLAEELKQRKSMEETLCSVTSTMLSQATDLTQERNHSVADLFKTLLKDVDADLQETRREKELEFQEKLENLVDEHEKQFAELETRNNTLNKFYRNVVNAVGQKRKDVFDERLRIIESVRELAKLSNAKKGKKKK